MVEQTWKNIVTETTHEKQKIFDGEVFPLILTPKNDQRGIDFVNWAKTHKKELAQELVKFGAILFRGFPIESAEDFSDFTEALGIKPLPYVGGAAVRHTVYKDVFTTNESPPDQPIPFHHEMAQVPKYPENILFYCHVAPAYNGETSIMRSDVAYKKINELKPDFCSAIEQHGVVYNRTIKGEDDPTSPVGRGWKATFNATNEKQAEEHAKNLGVTLKWLENGDVLTKSPVLKAIKTVPSNGRKVWFNSIVAAYTGCSDDRNEKKRSVMLGNGEYLKEEDIQAAVDVMEEFHVDIPWQNGDVMWIDNNQVLHSRKPNFPLPRKVMAYLGANKPWEE